MEGKIPSTSSYASPIGIPITTDTTAAVHIAEGQWLGYSGKFSEAISEFERALQLDPKSPWIFNYRGLTYFEMKKYDEVRVSPMFSLMFEALKDLTSAIQFDDSQLDFYMTRAKIYNEMGQMENAAKDAMKVVVT